MTALELLQDCADRRAVATGAAVRESALDRLRRSTRLNVGIGRTSHPTWARTPAAMNAATSIANQIPTMVSRLLPLGLK
jgi:hypothetical protein